MDAIWGATGGDRIRIQNFRSPRKRVGYIFGTCKAAREEDEKRGGNAAREDAGKVGASVDETTWDS